MSAKLQQRGGTHCMRELFEEWGLPAEFYKRMSPAWECELARSGRTDGEMLDACMNAQPLLVPQHFADDVFNTVGPDVFDFIQRPEWNQFPRPRIAMIGGWGAPGTHALGEDHLTLVNSFSEILGSEKRVNLQMFHREGDDTPKLPRLPDMLKWPLQDLLDGPDGSWGVKCDIATRISRQGAVTWWHLDDGGEFVLQVGLPIGASRLKEPVLLGPTGKPVVKLFIFAVKEQYEFITQDAVMHETNRFCQLHLFETPSEHLPVQDREAAAASGVLPKFWVAPLEAGGQLLLSPANLPHCVITLQDCVMVEMRKIFKLFLDEVAYFERRAALWHEQPIFYPFISNDLRDPSKVRGIMRQLLEILRSESDFSSEAAQTARGSSRCGMAAAASDGGAAGDVQGTRGDAEDASNAAGIAGNSGGEGPAAFAVAPQAREELLRHACGERCDVAKSVVGAEVGTAGRGGSCLETTDQPLGGDGAAANDPADRQNELQPRGSGACHECSCHALSQSTTLAPTALMMSQTDDSDCGARSGAHKGPGLAASGRECSGRSACGSAPCRERCGGGGVLNDAAHAKSAHSCARLMQQCRRSRAFQSIKAMLDSEFVAVDAPLRQEALAVLEEVAASVSQDPRAAVQAATLESMQRRVKGVTEFPSVCSNTSCVGGFAAYVHVQGRPRWGPVRHSVVVAKTDRKQLLAAKRAGRLDEVLMEMHRDSGLQR